MTDEEPDADIQDLLRALQSRKPVQQIKLGEDETGRLDDTVFDPRDVTLTCVIREEIDATHFKFGEKIFEVKMKVEQDLTTLDQTQRDKMVLDTAAKYGVGVTRGVYLPDRTGAHVIGIVSYAYCDSAKLVKRKRVFPHPVVRR